MTDKKGIDHITRECERLAGYPMREERRMTDLTAQQLHDLVMRPWCPQCCKPAAMADVCETSYAETGVRCGVAMVKPLWERWPQTRPEGLESGASGFIFQAEYGEDPRELDEADTRWLTYRSQFLTRFMKRLRQDLDDLARTQQRSQPYPVSAWVFGSEEENLFYGIDVRNWVEQGLVDTLIPYTSAKKLFSFELAWEKPSDVEYWLSLTQGTQCQVAFNLMPRNMDARQYRRKANALYQLGAEHLAFWDTAITGGRASEVLRRLGHREEIAEWISAGKQVPERPSSPLRKLEQWDLDYFPE